MVVLADRVAGQMGRGRHEIVRMEPKGVAAFGCAARSGRQSAMTSREALRDPPPTSADVRRCA